MTHRLKAPWGRSITLAPVLPPYSQYGVAIEVYELLRLVDIPGLDIALVPNNLRMLFHSNG